MARSKPAADYAAELEKLVARAPAARAAILRFRLDIAKAQLDELDREVATLWGLRQLVAALVDEEPRLAKKFGLIATRLEGVPRPSATRAVAQVVGPIVTRALAFAGGKPPGALDALGREILDILKADPRMEPDNILDALKARAGRGGVIVAVREGLPKRAPGPGKRNRGSLVTWRHPERGEQETAWSSIRKRRLGRLRRLVLAKPR